MAPLGADDRRPDSKRLGMIRDDPAQARLADHKRPPGCARRARTDAGRHEGRQSDQRRSHFRMIAPRRCPRDFESTPVKGLGCAGNGYWTRYSLADASRDRATSGCTPQAALADVQCPEHTACRPGRAPCSHAGAHIARSGTPPDRWSATSAFANRQGPAPEGSAAGKQALGTVQLRQIAGRDMASTVRVSATRRAPLRSRRACSSADLA